VRWRQAVARALERLEADYARYLNVRRRAPGHLWQARFYSAPTGLSACWRVLAYVERNPVRAAMVERAECYLWSSAAARLRQGSAPPWLRLAEWGRNWSAAEWKDVLRDQSRDPVTREQLRTATLCGRPLGDDLARSLEVRLGTRIGPRKPGRPPRESK
jgi:putative transposase